MVEKKDWYGHGVRSLCSEIRNTASIDTFRLTRVLYIYSWMDLFMKLCSDYKKCDNQVTKNLIMEEMKELADELRHYKIFDDRFEEMFDEGR